MKSREIFDHRPPESLVNEGEFVRLQPGIPTVIDTENIQAIDSDGTRVVTTIQAGDQEFLILDTRDELKRNLTNVPFLLVGKNFRKQGQRHRGFKGLKYGEEVQMGRVLLQDRFDHEDDTTLSRNHFEVKLTEDGMLVVTDTESTNGTKVFQAQSSGSMFERAKVKIGKMANPQKDDKNADYQEFHEKLRIQKERDLAERRAKQAAKNRRLREERARREASSAQDSGVNQNERSQDRQAYIRKIADPRLRHVVEEHGGQFGDVPIARFADVMKLIIEQKSAGVPDKKIYQQLARDLHPDRNPDDEHAGILFRAVGSAYDPKNKVFKF